MDDLDHAAAIIEYEGNVSRQDAERLAWSRFAIATSARGGLLEIRGVA